MMSMILQVGAVPIGFTSQGSDSHEGVYCHLCQHTGENYFFPTTMSWQHLGNVSPLPDLIPGGSPQSSQQRHEDPFQSFFPSEAFPSEPSSTYYPLTPSPTPVRGRCPTCIIRDQDEPFSLKISDTDSNTRKVQLKLEHIQDVRQRLQEDHLFFRGNCQNQQGLPQLSWDLPPRRRQPNQHPIQQQLTASSASTQKRKDSNKTASKASGGFKAANSTADSQAVEEEEEEEEIDVYEWRRIGTELRFVADGFHRNYSSTLNSNGNRRTFVPSYISYVVATSLFFLMSWRLISRYR